MKKFPIAERFTSPQGEGLYAGTLMYFIRFAGCSVGKKLSDSERRGWEQKIDHFHSKENELLAVYTEKCCTYDGREFLCDTDFRTKEALTMKELLDGIPKGVGHICLTGGEPLNQPLSEFFDFIGSETDYKVHVETSGTVSMEDTWPEYTAADSLEAWHEGGWLWITVSPKKGLLSEMIGIANEIKLLVDENFDVEKIPDDIKDHRLVWLQPINTEFEVDRRNLDRCLSLLQEHKNWRLSSQMHKTWRVR